MKRYTLLTWILLSLSILLYLLGQKRAKYDLVSAQITRQSFSTEDTESTQRLLVDPNTNSYILEPIFSFNSYDTKTLYQKVREYCAFDIKKSNLQWLTFIANMQQNCQSENLDYCWQDQAENVGLNHIEITSCFTTNFNDIISK